MQIMFQNVENVNNLIHFESEIDNKIIDDKEEISPERVLIDNIFDSLQKEKANVLNGFEIVDTYPGNPQNGIEIVVLKTENEFYESKTKVFFQ